MPHRPRRRVGNARRRTTRSRGRGCAWLGNGPRRAAAREGRRSRRTRDPRDQDHARGSAGEGWPSRSLLYRTRHTPRRGCLGQRRDARSRPTASSRRPTFSGSAASRSRMRTSSASSRRSSFSTTRWRSWLFIDCSARMKAPCASVARRSSSRRAIAEYEAPPSRRSRASRSTTAPGLLRLGSGRSRGLWETVPLPSDRFRDPCLATVPSQDAPGAGDPLSPGGCAANGGRRRPRRCRSARHTAEASSGH
jgi:hypothetical protein